MADVTLSVGGWSYSGWSRAGITRTIEGLSGSFSLAVADERADTALQALSWPVRVEDECTIKIDSRTVIDGWISSRSPSFSATSKALALRGKDRSAALVECSALLEKWTFRKATVVDVARKLAEPYGITVTSQVGLELLPAQDKVVISQGETAFSALDAMAKAAGVMIVSNGNGGILITRSGTSRASQELIEGVNLKAGNLSEEAAERFRVYTVSSQIPATDRSPGNAARVSAQAVDLGVRRTDRQLLIRPEAGLTAQHARQRADWEARIRAARAESASLVVHGWEQSDGDLWPINALVYVRSKTLGIDADMLISQAEHTKDSESGEITTLRVVRPDAFTPEPQARVSA